MTFPVGAGRLGASFGENAHGSPSAVSVIRWPLCGEVDAVGGFGVAAVGASPGPGREFGDALAGVAADHGVEDAGQVGVRIEIVHFCRLNQRVDNRGPASALVGSKEQKILSRYGNRPFILPVSDKMLKSFIAGTLILVAASV